MTPTPLQPRDAPAVLALHDAVRAALQDPSLFQLWGGAESFVAAHLPGPAARGESWGIWDRESGNRLLAYGSLTRPQADDADNYANRLNWPAPRAAQVGLLSAAMVAPDWRGQGLQGRLIDARLARAAALGLPELLVRASPQNAVSQAALLHRGFAIVWLGEQAGGLLRHLYWRPVAGLEPARPRAWIAIDDLDAQREALARGWIGRALDGGGRIGFG